MKISDRVAELRPSWMKPDTTPLSEIPVPRLQRRFVWFNILDAFDGELNRESVERIAKELYSDSAEGRTRSLTEICVAADIGGEKQRRRLTRDEFFSHVSLEYRKREMEQDMPKTILPDGGEITGFMEVMAGNGWERPLLMDLYWLGIDANLVNTVRAMTQQAYTEKYCLANGGKGWARVNVINVTCPRSFNTIRRQNLLIVAQENGAELRPRNSTPSA